MALERLIANFKAPLRRETLEGKNYLVAPAAILQEGVWNGSRGPIYYPKSEIDKSVTSWDHKPSVMYHPEINGQGVSACKPEIIESRKVGMMLQTEANDKLRTEVWIDEAKTKQVYPDLLTAMEKGDLVEVSTGLFMDAIPEPGEFNGKKYDFIARNFRPDHLAILPDKIGAYSIEDGGGLFQTNEDPTKKKDPPKLDQKQFYAELQKKKIEGFGTTKYHANVVANDGKETIVNNVISHQDVAKGLTAAMLAEEGKTNGYWPGYVEDVYDSFFIYSQDGKYFKKGYSLDANYNANPFGKPEEVKKHKEYRDMSGGHVAVTGRDMSGSKVAPDGGGKGTEQPQTPILGHGKHVLPGSTAPIGDQGGSPSRAFSFNEAGTMTTEEFIKQAPPEVQTLLNNALEGQAAQKKALVEAIVANAKNKFKKEWLEAQPVPTLQGIYALAEPIPSPVDNNNPLMTPLYLGAAGSGPIPTNNIGETLSKAPGLTPSGITFNENVLEEHEKRQAGGVRRR